MAINRKRTIQTTRKIFYSNFTVFRKQKSRVQTANIKRKTEQITMENHPLKRQKQKKKEQRYEIIQKQKINSQQYVLTYKQSSEM